MDISNEHEILFMSVTSHQNAPPCHFYSSWLSESIDKLFCMKILFSLNLYHHPVEERQQCGKIPACMQLAAVQFVRNM